MRLCVLVARVDKHYFFSELISAINYFYDKKKINTNITSNTSKIKYESLYIKYGYFRVVFLSLLITSALSLCKYLYFSDLQIAK